MVTIQNGKFYKDGKVMPVEFGNKEQAEVFEKASKYEKVLKDGLELYPTTEVTFSASFKCFCGTYISFEGNSSDPEYVDVLANETLKCKCGKHKFETYMSLGSLMVKEVNS